ncbi:hypothetical protein [Pseudomonas sp. dw_358]|uniref:hypothetical protein n=1 Tax=Pseudomonas sp. dw_358 TaxID=2720083 RepID=UPI001BD4F320|nr:hypothetical protein [Pseudomonas sp. dw_358]
MQQYDTNSFVASLHCIYNGRKMAVGSSDTLFSLDKNWLVLDGSPVRASGHPLRLGFEYTGRGHDRLHYHVHGLLPFAGQVGLSSHGYLGLYEVAVVSDYWKVEPLEHWSLEVGRELRCNLRDVLGHQVGIYLGAYLTVGAEYLTDFWLEVLEVGD